MRRSTGRFGVSMRAWGEAHHTAGTAELSVAHQVPVLATTPHCPKRGIMAPAPGCSRIGYGMKLQALEAERHAILAEWEALVSTYARLRSRPANSQEHAEHRIRIQKHQDRLRAYIRALRNQPRHN